MTRRHQQPLPEPKARPSSSWLEAALCAKDPNAFLMGLDETEFAALLAELDAIRSTVIVTGMSASALEREMETEQ